MLFDRMTRKLKPLAGDGCKLLAISAAAAITMALMPLVAPPANATDVDATQVGTADAGHFVRIGLHKSIVIRLPAEAKDVIVGDPTIVDAVVRTKNTAYLFARLPGQTNIFFFDAQGRQIMNIDLEVALDMTALQKLIKRTIPGTRITVDTIDEKVVLGGMAANAQEAKIAEDLAAKFVSGPDMVVNAMKISGGDQVMLKVRVVEIKRDILKQLGINIDNLAFDIGNVAFNFATSNPVSASSFFGGLGASSGSFDINASIQAMESDGVLHMLAEPTLTAVSGQSATFHAGGEFDAGNACTAFSGGSGDSCGPVFKSFGVSLGFTPFVLTEGRISLKIVTEVSDLDPVNSTATSRALVTRNAETTVELPSGGSMMLAGLIKDVSTQAIRGTPGLKNLPVLGALFRSQDFTSNQSELVVIVTPYIVNAVNEKQLKTPDYRFQEATDRQANFFGRLNRIYGTPGLYPDGVYHGNVGFVIE